MMQVPSKQAGDPFSEREEQATTSAAAQPAKASTSRPQQHHVGTASPWGGLGRPIGRDEGLVGGTASTSSKKPVSAPPAFTSVSGGASTLRKAPKPKQHVKGRLGSNGVFGQQQRRAKNGKAREKAPLLPPISPSLSSEVDFGAEVKSDWQGGEYEMDAFLTKFFRVVRPTRSYRSFLVSDPLVTCRQLSRSRPSSAVSEKLTISFRANASWASWAPTSTRLARTRTSSLTLFVVPSD